MKLSDRVNFKVVKAIGIPFLVIALGFGINTLLHVTKPVPEQKEKEVRPLSVFVAPVQSRSTVLEVRAQGEVRARTEVDLVAQVGGRIVAVSSEFTEGGKVEPGVTLVTIEDTDYKLALIQAEVRVAEAEVRVQQALATADVARKQLRNDHNATALALKKPQVEEARARLRAAKADLEQARLNLERTRIALPFSGRLVNTKVDVGQFITPGTRLGKAFSTDVVEVRLAFTDSQLASLGLPIGYVASEFPDAADENPGRRVEFSAVVAGVEQHWVGRLVRLDASVDSQTRLFYGMAEVIDPYGQNVSEYDMPMAVGLYVDAVIAGQVVDKAHLIPRQALRAGNKVYLVNSEGELEIRDVTVLHSSAEEAFISNGLLLGDQVVTSSIRNASEGMSLSPMPQERVAAKPEVEEDASINNSSETAEKES